MQFQSPLTTDHHSVANVIPSAMRTAKDTASVHECSVIRRRVSINRRTSWTDILASVKYTSQSSSSSSSSSSVQQKTLYIHRSTAAATQQQTNTANRRISVITSGHAAELGHCVHRPFRFWVCSTDGLAKASEPRGQRGRSPPQCWNRGGEKIFSPPQ